MSKVSPGRSASLAVLVATLLIGAPVCQSVEAAGPETDKLGRRLWEDYLEAVMAGQPERIAFAKEAVLIYPELDPLRGRDAIQAHLAKALASQKIVKAGFKVDRFEVVGTRAYSFVVMDELIQEGAGPQARRLARCATVWEQQPDQSWQIVHFLVNYRKP